MLHNFTTSIILKSLMIMLQVLKSVNVTRKMSYKFFTTFLNFEESSISLLLSAHSSTSQTSFWSLHKTSAVTSFITQYYFVFS